MQHKCPMNLSESLKNNHVLSFVNQLIYCNPLPRSLASSTSKISSNKCFGDRLITLQTVLIKTDQASLWNTIIIDVVGKSDRYFLLIHLCGIDDTLKYINSSVTRKKILTIFCEHLANFGSMAFDRLPLN